MPIHTQLSAPSKLYRHKESKKLVKGKKSQSSLLCPTGSFEIRSHLQKCCGTAGKIPESPVDAPGGLHTQWLTTSH